MFRLDHFLRHELLGQGVFQCRVVTLGRNILQSRFLVTVDIVQWNGYLARVLVHILPVQDLLVTPIDSTTASIMLLSRCLTGEPLVLIYDRSVWRFRILQLVNVFYVGSFLCLNIDSRTLVLCVKHWLSLLNLDLCDTYDSYVPKVLSQFLFILAALSNKRSQVPRQRVIVSFFSRL